MKILFIADPLDQFKIAKDSTYAMMKEAAERGHIIYTCCVDDISWQPESVWAQVLQINLQTDSQDWYKIIAQTGFSLSDFDVVLVRKDPPFDQNYLYLTYILERAEQLGARIFNAPRALRDHNEKLATTEFSDLMTPSLVSQNIAVLKRFHKEHQDVIFKPLDNMGGQGVFRITDNAMNLGSVLEMLTENGCKMIMAQRFIPAITEGDKRILLIAGQVVPYALARIAQAQEVRANLAAGGHGVAMPLTAKEQEFANYLAPILWQRGLLLVGLDVIGACLTEINVTSPTCMQEIYTQTGYNPALVLIEALEKIIG